MLPQRRGLIVSTTANLDALPYLRNIFYDLSKNAVARLAWAMAQELRDHGIATLAVAPGFMRTERIVEAFRRAGAAAALDGPGGPKETTAYLGRAVVALASDGRVIESQVNCSMSARWPESTGSRTSRHTAAALSHAREQVAPTEDLCASTIQ